MTKPVVDQEATPAAEATSDAVEQETPATEQAEVEETSEATQQEETEELSPEDEETLKALEWVGKKYGLDPESMSDSEREMAATFGKRELQMNREGRRNYRENRELKQRLAQLEQARMEPEEEESEEKTSPSVPATPSLQRLQTKLDRLDRRQNDISTQWESCRKSAAAAAKAVVRAEVRLEQADTTEREERELELQTANDRYASFSREEQRLRAEFNNSEDDKLELQERLAEETNRLKSEEKQRIQREKAERRWQESNFRAIQTAALSVADELELQFEDVEDEQEFVQATHDLVAAKLAKSVRSWQRKHPGEGRPPAVDLAELAREVVLEQHGKPGKKVMLEGKKKVEALRKLRSSITQPSKTQPFKLPESEHPQTDIQAARSDCMAAERAAEERLARLLG